MSTSLLEQKKAELSKRFSKLEKMREKNLISFFQPLSSSRRDNPYQQRALDAFHSGKKIVLMPVSNKVGKTAEAVCVTGSWCLGYEPWNAVTADHPKAVKVGDGYFHESSLGIKPPIRMRITGEDWTHSIGQTIIPEMKKWLPEDSYSTKKNSQGIEYFWTFANGSTVEIMTHDQDMKLFESWLGDAWWPDEPPPKPIWSAMSRGLFTTGGKVFMPTTPLSEAWVLDDLVLNPRPDVAIIDDVNIWDNPLIYNKDVATLEAAGLTPAEIESFMRLSMEFKDAKGWLRELLIGKYDEVKGDDLWAETYTNLKIERFIADTPEELRMTRMYGKFKSLVGRVLKEYNPDLHNIQPFEVPSDWPVTAAIDFHLNKPHAISFFATDPRGIDYIVDEVWDNISSEEIADAIIRRKRARGWRIEMAFIDPLSKGDTKFMRNRMGNVKDSFTIIKNRLLPHGILLEVGSKDKTSGISIIRDKLKGVNGLPTFFVFETCKMHIHQFLRWVFGDDGLPKKEDDDFPENWYRYVLFNVQYTDPARLKRKIINKLSKAVV